MQASSGQQRTLEIYLVKKVAPQIKRSVSRTWYAAGQGPVDRSYLFWLEFDQNKKQFAV